MPYRSMKQERFAHTPTAKKAGFPTKEFDKASKGMKLPKVATPKADAKESMGRIASARMGDDAMV